MLMEKTGTNTTSGFGHSQTMSFGNVSQDHKMSYYNSLLKDPNIGQNPQHCTPTDVMGQMGKDYSLFKDNCQDAASRALQHCNKK